MTHNPEHTAPDAASGAPSYNAIAGRSLERIAALSDGLFAIAMTLIVLEIHIPPPAGVRDEADLWRVLGALAPRLVTYLMSFLTLGIFWTGQQTQLSHLRRADRDAGWLHLAFLAAVSLMPLSTSLLAEYITFRTALVLYWANIVLLGALLHAAWAYALRAGLVRDDAPPGVDTAVRRRIVVAQALYAVGVALCVFGTGWSIGWLVLVQLNYAVAPRVLGLDRL